MQSLKFTSFVIACLFALGAIVSLGSCGDEIEEALDSVTYTITVDNNTGQDFELFESVDGSEFETLGAIGAGTSLELLGIVDTELVIEARREDGSVYAMRTFNQADETDVTWEIN